jgi:plasmid stabilization system protein ParE
MAFKILHHEDALADLGEIFEWSRDRHPDTSDRFAEEFFSHLEFLGVSPYLGTAVRDQFNVHSLAAYHLLPRR